MPTLEVLLQDLTPPNATKLEEEGVVIDDFLICEGGKFREQEV